MHELFEICGSSIEGFSSIGFITFLVGCSVLGLFFLTKGGDLLSDNCSIFAKKIGIPPIIVGLTIVSVATSAPELFTSISAIKSNAGGLVLGNITGSNVANIGLILGISLFIKPISTHKAVKPSQLILLAIATIGFSTSVTFSKNSQLGLSTGIVLVTFISCYLVGLCIVCFKNRDAAKLISEENHEEKTSFLFVFVMILIGGSLLWLGSESLVFGSKNLAELAGIPNELIGFTLIAIGTSLPELAASIALIKKDETPMLLGNIIGSNLFNIGLVGGIAGILGPIVGESPHPWLDHLTMILFTTILILWMCGKHLTRKHGIFLLVLYTVTSATTWVANS